MLVRVKAIAGHFSSSSEAASALSAIQRTLSTILRNGASKDLKVIQDLSGKWWSTWNMIRRLRQLKNFLAVLVGKEELDAEINLNDEEWKILEEIDQLLEPFMIIQRWIEGQKHVTLSLIPFLITTVRKSLVTAAKSSRTIVVRELAESMLSDPVRGMERYWGKGDLNTLYEDTTVDGGNGGNGQKGFPLSTLLAAALDPRTKKLKLIGTDDKKKVWNELRRRMKALLQEKNVNEVACTSDLGVKGVAHEVGKNPLADLFRCHEDDSDLDEIVEEEKNTKKRNQNITVDAEIRYYKNLHSLDMILGDSDGGETFSDPLTWWNEQSKSLPLLSTLARRILCIPATSAPSESLFSSAGLSASKIRASLQPELASDVVFLHNSWKYAEERDKR